MPKPVAPRRKLRLTALLLVLVLIAAACGGSSKKNNAQSSGSAGATDTATPVLGGSLVYAQEAEDGGGLCLPEAQLDISGINYVRTIYDTLTAPDETGKFVPYLAEKVTPNADATEWTIVLRDGIKFHDGSPLTATVVKNNLDAYRGAYKGRSPQLFIFVYLNIKEVTADDATRTVKVTMNKPWSAFDSYLWGSNRIGIMGQAQLDDGAGCAKNLVGTGPFKLKEWTIGDHFTAVKNPDYWQKDSSGNQLPYLDEITFRPVPDSQVRFNGLQSKQFDIIHTSSNILEEQIRALASQGQITNLESDKFAETGHIMLCTIQDPTGKICPGTPFWNEHARKAVALAFDRDTWLHVRGKDIPQKASGPFAPGAIGFLDDAGFPAFNLQAAKDEVAAYKQETGKDLEFTYGTVTNPEGEESQNFTKGMFEAAGMKVSTYTVEQARYIDVAVARNFQMYDWRNFPGSDPDSLYVWWHCGNAPPEACDNPINFGAFNDAAISKDLDDGRVQTDATKRKTAYEDLNRQFSKSLYNLWLDWTVWSVPSQKNVHGIFGPNLPDGGKPFPGLAQGNPLLGLFKTT